MKYHEKQMYENSSSSSSSCFFSSTHLVTQNDWERSTSWAGTYKKQTKQQIPTTTKINGVSRRKP